MKRNLVVFSPNDSIFEVMKKFVKHKISGGPVLNKNGKIVGVISEADCMKEISDSRYFNMPILDKRVKNFMQKNVDTINSSTSIFDAASRFYNSSRRRFPVIENQKLVGQISRKDIVIAAINMQSQTWFK
ncbi:MAG: CBS domain-containing protein [Bacteroidota bacterium]|nr:inosine-5-monophosphate dehydrogenase [Flavobacteriaceae bacterium]MEC7869472.1 CBS domain-containing protein [Bacteroidota bacterium]